MIFYILFNLLYFYFIIANNNVIAIAIYCAFMYIILDLNLFAYMIFYINYKK